MHNNPRTHRCTLDCILDDSAESHLVSVVGLAAAVALSILTIQLLLSDAFRTSGLALLDEIRCAATSGPCGDSPTANTPENAENGEAIVIPIDGPDGTVTVEVDAAAFNFNNITPVDENGDGIIDYITADFDGDGQADYYQVVDNEQLTLVDTTGDGRPDTYVFDFDGDGTIDQQVSAPLPNLSTFLQNNPDAQLTLENFIPADQDGDGVIDAYAIDLNNDGQPDILQQLDGTTLAISDTNGDGVNDTISYDSNGDGVLDQSLTTTSAPSPVPATLDLDGDGVIDPGKFASANDCLAAGVCTDAWFREQFTDYLRSENMQLIDANEDGIIDYYAIDINLDGEADLFDRVDGSGGIRFRDGGFVDIDLDNDGIFDQTTINAVDLSWEDEDEKVRFFWDTEDGDYKDFKAFGNIAYDGGLNFGEGGNDTTFFWDDGSDCPFSSDCVASTDQINSLIVTDQQIANLRDARNRFDFEQAPSSGEEDTKYYLTNESAESLRELGLDEYLVPYEHTYSGWTGRGRNYSTDTEQLGWRLTQEGQQQLAAITGLPPGVDFLTPNGGVDFSPLRFLDDTDLSIAEAENQYANAIANQDVDYKQKSSFNPLKTFGKIVVGGVSAAFCGPCAIGTVALYDTVVEGGGIADFGKNLIGGAVDYFVPGVGGTIAGSLTDSFLEDGKLTGGEIGQAFIAGGTQLGGDILGDAIADNVGFISPEAGGILGSNIVNTAVTGDVGAGLANTAGDLTGLGIGNVAIDNGLDPNTSSLLANVGGNGTSAILNGESIDQYLARIEPGVARSLGQAIQSNNDGANTEPTEQVQLSFATDENGNPIILPTFGADNLAETGETGANSTAANTGDAPTQNFQFRPPPIYLASTDENPDVNYGAADYSGWSEDFYNNRQTNIDPTPGGVLRKTSTSENTRSFKPSKGGTGPGSTVKADPGGTLENVQKIGVGVDLAGVGGEAYGIDESASGKFWFLPFSSNRKQQVGAYGANVGVGYGENGANAGVSASTSALKGQDTWVLGNDKFGVVFSLGGDAGTADASAGVANNNVGFTGGLKAFALNGQAGLNIGGVYIGGSAEAGLQGAIGVKVGSDTSLSVGPFKFGISVGKAKDYTVDPSEAD